MYFHVLERKWHKVSVLWVAQVVALFVEDNLATCTVHRTNFTSPLKGITELAHLVRAIDLNHWVVSVFSLIIPTINGKLPVNWSKVSVAVGQIVKSCCLLVDSLQFKKNCDIQHQFAFKFESAQMFEFPSSCWDALARLQAWVIFGVSAAWYCDCCSRFSSACCNSSSLQAATDRS